MKFVIDSFELDVQIDNQDQPYIIIKPNNNFPGRLNLRIPANTSAKRADEIKNYLEKYIRQIEYIR